MNKKTNKYYLIKMSLKLLVLTSNIIECQSKIYLCIMSNSNKFTSVLENQTIFKNTPLCLELKIEIRITKSLANNGVSGRGTDLYWSNAAVE